MMLTPYLISSVLFAMLLFYAADMEYVARHATVALALSALLWFATIVLLARSGW